MRRIKERIIEESAILNIRDGKGILIEEALIITRSSLNRIFALSEESQ